MKINTSMVEHLSIVLDESADIDAEREILAAKMRKLYGDRLLAPDMPIYTTCRRVDFDGVPIRYMELADICRGETLRRLDAIGYPEEAICH